MTQMISKTQAPVKRAGRIDPIAFFERFGVLIFMILLLIFFQSQNSNFFSERNIFNILTEVSIYGIMAVIGLLTWPQLARLIRGQTLILRNAEYVVASESLGASKGRQMFVHILPQTLASLLVFATFGIANAILLEAGLSFLGQGVQPPTPSWGNMVETARSLDILENLPWTWFAPGMFIVLTVISINFIGDALRDAVDPKSR